MKKKLVFASKILLSATILSLFTIIMIACYSKGSEINLPDWLAISSVGITVITVVVFLVEFVLEIKASWKENGFRAILIPLGQMLIYLLVFLVCDFGITRKASRMGYYLFSAVVMMVIMTVLNYWKRIGKAE